MKAKDLIWTQANGTASSLKELETSLMQQYQKEIDNGTE